MVDFMVIIVLCSYNFVLYGIYKWYGKDGYSGHKQKILK
jgi:hypothetical protein